MPCWLPFIFFPGFLSPNNNIDYMLIQLRDFLETHNLRETQIYAKVENAEVSNSCLISKYIHQVNVCFT